MLFEINKLNLIGIPVNIDLLLFGNETLNCDINWVFFLTTIIFYSNACYNQLHKPKLLMKQYIYIYIYNINIEKFVTQ